VRVQVIHRDLKLGNLFLNDNLEVKVGDFGLATRVEVEGERKRWVSLRIEGWCVYSLACSDPVSQNTMWNAQLHCPRGLGEERTQL
jgi:serine/threonine protein kinase